MRPVEFPHFPPHGGPVFSLIFSALQNYKTPFPSPFPSLIRFTRWMTKKGGIKEEWKRRVEEETTYLRVQPSYPANSALSLTPRRRFNLWFNASKKGEGEKRKDLRGCPVFRIEGWRFFTNFLSVLMLAARVAQGIENVDVSKEREWPVSRATKAPPPPLWSLPSFQPFSLSLALFHFTLHTVVSILVRTSPFVAQFHLPVSRQLSRENCEKGWGRERGNSLRGSLVPTRHYLAPERPAGYADDALTPSRLLEEGKREKIYISCI